MRSEGDNCRKGLKIVTPAVTPNRNLVMDGIEPSVINHILV